jgi:hypothetical protein
MKPALLLNKNYIVIELFRKERSDRQRALFILYADGEQEVPEL